MEYRPFGKTDLRVSAIGFGCWEVGGTYGRIDRGQFDRAVHQAIDGGITCFDTAEAYGMGVSEEALAEALGRRRNQVSSSPNSVSATRRCRAAATPAVAGCLPRSTGASGGCAPAMSMPISSTGRTR